MKYMIPANQHKDVWIGPGPIDELEVSNNHEEKNLIVEVLSKNKVDRNGFYWTIEPGEGKQVFTSYVHLLNRTEETLMVALYWERNGNNHVCKTCGAHEECIIGNYYQPTCSCPKGKTSKELTDFIYGDNPIVVRQNAGLICSSFLDGLIVEEELPGKLHEEERAAISTVINSMTLVAPTNEKHPLSTYGPVWVDRFASAMLKLNRVLKLMKKEKEKNNGNI